MITDTLDRRKICRKHTCSNSSSVAQSYNSFTPLNSKILIVLIVKFVLYTAWFKDLIANPLSTTLVVYK